MTRRAVVEHSWREPLWRENTRFRYSRNPQKAGAGVFSHKRKDHTLNADAGQTLPRLSKSRFLAGLQCMKRLYLECRHRDLADPVSASRQALFDSGTSVGELARQRFAGGALVEEEYFERRQAERTTQRLLADETIPALYEPAFSFGGIHTRVDILKRTEDGQFDLIEGQVQHGPEGRSRPGRCDPDARPGGLRPPD